MDPKWLAPPSQADKEGIIPSLVGANTGKNLKTAFAKSSEAHLRYLYFAQKADIEGYNDVSTVFPGRPPWARPAMRTAISTSSPRSVTR